jgi:hypothetical protein
MFLLLRRSFVVVQCGQSRSIFVLPVNVGLVEKQVRPHEGDKDRREQRLQFVKISDILYQNIHFTLHSNITWKEWLGFLFV